jgi:spermidine/putrescine transport system substrate-binding protein
MKNVKSLAGAALALGMIAGCGPSKPELHIYTWSDYVDEDVKSKFEEENNCKVVIDTFDSNEAMYAKLQAGSTGYDIITPSSYQIPLMAKNKMIIPLDHSKIPNVKKNFDAAFANSILDPSFTYNAPYMVTYTGIAYRKDKIVKDVPVDSWKIYETAALKGRMSLLSDMRETIGAALKSLGYSLNSEKKEELDKAVEVVLKWKKNIAKFDNEQYKTAVAAGEWFVGHGYSSDVTQIMLEDDKVGFSLPKEGFTIAFDEMVIAADAPQKELAHKFIDFMYRPEMAKANMESVCAPMPVKAALEALKPELKALIVKDADTIKRGEVLRDFDDKPEVRKMYIEAWDKIKAGE